MYLDFIIDILHQGDSITIHCDNDVYTGVILKNDQGYDSNKAFNRQYYHKAR